MEPQSHWKHIYSTWAAYVAQVRRDHVTEQHRTPAGVVQQFVYCHCVLH